MALVCICFDNTENASVVATSRLFKPMLDQALRPIIEIRQQEEVLSLLQLLQTIYAVAPEAPALVPVLPRVVALLMGAHEGHPACNAVRLAALEVLVSCSLSQQRRSQLASLLPESLLMTFVSGVEGKGSPMAFPLGLMLANLSDIFIPEATTRFGSISHSFWERTGFFDDLLSCLEATLNSEAWPPQSLVFHTPWKLVNTYLRLSRAGFSDALHDAITPLVALVERQASNDSVPSADDAKAARLAEEVVQELTTDPTSLAQMRMAQSCAEASTTQSEAQGTAQEEGTKCATK